ncbi:MAG: sugar ABC transporter ATP-binding protein [Flexilinea flocculi]|nr:sugar ABC transporter ATP-binding protein [Flexilinea flocculi]
MAEPFLSLKQVSKHYAGVTALDKINFEINPGEIHCLAGENGSGKSTMIKIISGTVKADSGSVIEINGAPIQSMNAMDAINRGIQVIYQDLSSFPNLTVAENIALDYYVANHRKVVNWKELNQIAERAQSRIGVHLPLDANVNEISIADQQLAAICRALTRDVKLLIMDEPTSSLTKREVDSLLAVVLEMKKKGISTIFVSHKLNEVLEIADRVSVLRDGKMIGTYPAKELDNDSLTFLMTGMKVEYEPFQFAGKFDHPILELNHVSKKGEYKDISFELFPGEILGLTGLLGSGRTELALSIFGKTKPDQGEILINGQPVKINSIQDALRYGIAYVPEDRLIQGLVTTQSVGQNIILTTLDQMTTRRHFLDAVKIRNSIEHWVKDLSIKVPSVQSPVQTLSGGNQQRVVLAKWIAADPKILILDGPTIGIDVAAKRSIHEIIRSLAKRGISVIMISEEIPEVYHNCSRILVMHKGSLMKTFITQNTSIDEIQNYVNGTV